MSRMPDVDQLHTDQTSKEIQKHCSGTCKIKWDKGIITKDGKKEEEPTGIGILLSWNTTSDTRNTSPMLAPLTCICSTNQHFNYMIKINQLKLYENRGISGIERFS